MMSSYLIDGLIVEKPRAERFTVPTMAPRIGAAAR
jgi:hypothetical protein